KLLASLTQPVGPGSRIPAQLALAKKLGSPTSNKPAHCPATPTNMRTIPTTIVIALGLFAVSQTQAAETDAAKKDLAQLQGEWTMVSGSADGQTMPEEMRKQMKRVCTMDELTVTIAGQVYLKAKITLDPSKTPKTINYQMTDGFTKGQTQLGIYEF